MTWAELEVTQQLCLVVREQERACVCVTATPMLTDKACLAFGSLFLLGFAKCLFIGP